MASISCDKRGFRRILFFDGDKRRTIHLGDVNKGTAVGTKLHVERLINARQFGQPLPTETAGWLLTIGETLHGRIVAASLADPRVAGVVSLVPTIDQLTADYIARRSDLKKFTIKNFGQARLTLLKFFGPDTPGRRHQPRPCRRLPPLAGMPQVGRSNHQHEHQKMPPVFH